MYYLYTVDKSMNGYDFLTFSRISEAVMCPLEWRTTENIIRR